MVTTWHRDPSSSESTSQWLERGIAWHSPPGAFVQLWLRGLIAYHGFVHCTRSRGRCLRYVCGRRFPCEISAVCSNTVDPG